MQTDGIRIGRWGSGLLGISRGVIAVSVLIAAVLIIWTALQDGVSDLVLIFVGLWLVSLAVGVFALVTAVVGLLLKKHGRQKRTKLDVLALVVAVVLTSIGISGVLVLFANLWIWW
ncbi:hypothetical protein GY21_10145 [Cryobacterium roopkundense]|uniref:Chromate transport protein ChrA n=1 Tax=Cryobacterium roopkundense TaxID=1001240 RepID=A0A099JBK2_9MICO|nr:hypothetical protein [Cryobacterium roopkundense]KGJ74883.1 hypothetical protein GY21_10145 [Cryobacterium roopkundense]MBB5640613.1 chromate transport protein ChrA [Cryobacterium roopkundense]